MLTPSSLSSERRSHASEFSRSGDELPDAEVAELKDANDELEPSEIGNAENISKSYVSRILRLALLAPDLVESMLAEQTDHTLMLEKLERPLPASWEEQRPQVLGG